MAKRNRQTTQRKIEKWIKEGRGQETNEGHKPWLTIQDVPSLGLTCRRKGLKSKRVHQLLSQLETRAFLIFDWMPNFKNIREQYPLLPQDNTLRIAKKLGIVHPTDPKTRVPIVMTTDFYLTCRIGLKTIYQAVTVKYKKELQNSRVREKLEIERLYWRARGIKLYVMTEEEINEDLAENLRILKGYIQIRDRVQLSKAKLTMIAQELTRRVLASSLPLRKVTKNLDADLHLKRGTSITVAWHLLATRRWIVDLTSPLQPGKRWNIQVSNDRKGRK